MNQDQLLKNFIVAYGSTIQGIMGACRAAYSQTVKIMGEAGIVVTIIALQRFLLEVALGANIDPDLMRAINDNLIVYQKELLCGVKGNSNNPMN